MDTNGHETEVLEAALVYRIVGCAFEVMNALGHGLHEKPYENALAVEFRLQGIAFDQQARFPVFYKGTAVSEYVPDLLVERRVIVDTKTVDRITDHERGQMLNYLRIAQVRVGVIINFKHRKLGWERVVL